MTSISMRVTIQEFLYDMAELDEAKNKSARIQELVTKGLMAERQEIRKSPPSSFWTGNLFEPSQTVLVA